jgi:hypothetical protein
MKMLCVVLLATVMASATELDSKSLYVGIGIGAGVAVTKNYIAIPLAKKTARATKKASKVTARTLKRAVQSK